MYLSTILTSGYSAGWSIVKLILITIFVLVLAFYSTRLIAKYQSNSLSSRNHIRFLESYRVDGNKMVAIVQIGNRYFALGIGKNEIHVIAELEDEEFHFSDRQELENGEALPKMKFKDVLASMKEKAKDNNKK